MRMVSLRILPVVFLVSVINAPFAHVSATEDPILSECSPTPEVASSGNSYPGRENIVPSNKLAKPAGKAVWADGELVYIAGRLFDQKCVPISDARIEIWQANPYGQYKWIDGGTRVNPYPAFAGSGRAVTDNLGRFYFITVFPGPYGNSAPHIHVKVTHPQFKTFNTEIFFEGDRRNSSDPTLSRFSAAERQKLTAKVTSRNANNRDKGLLAKFDITLRGQNKWRKF